VKTAVLVVVAFWVGWFTCFAQAIVGSKTLGIKDITALTRD